MSKKMTLRELSKELGLSVSTVSKALNDSHEISGETKERVQHLAREYRYRPNMNAVNLRRGRQKNLGVILPNVLNFFFALVLTGIEETANALGYNIICCMSDESYDKEVAAVQMLRDGGVSGMLLSLSEGTEKKGETAHLEALQGFGIPVVLFDRVSEAISCDKVIIDDFKAAYQATEHFIKTGCKHIALVTLLDSLGVGRLRAEGYRKCLEDNNIVVDEDLIVKVVDKDLFEPMASNLLQSKRVDAVLALEEFAAVHMMMVARNLGFEVPKDISIIGFTNGMLPKYMTPTITSVSQHGKFIGEKATRLLIDRIEMDGNHQIPFQTEVVKSTIVQRESTL
ncbi:MAG: LacI family DNA-binding transcriptional regulator [Bacteroidota bacterium]